MGATLADGGVNPLTKQRGRRVRLPLHARRDGDGWIVRNLRRLALRHRTARRRQAQVDLDSINFISNDRLQTVLSGTTATPAQVAEAVRVNTESRQRAFKIGLLIMASLSLLSIIPAGRLPDYRPGELPDRPTRKGNTTL